MYINILHVVQLTPLKGVAVNNGVATVSWYKTHFFQDKYKAFWTRQALQPKYIEIY